MRVLFPTDGSHRTEAAFERMLDLLGYVPDLDVLVFNVQQEGFEGADPQYVEETYETDERDEVFPSREASQRAIDRCVQIATKRGIEVETKIVTGAYKDEILSEAADHDVLAMHELGSSSLKDVFKGSSTEKLARQADCSVLLIDVDEG